MALFYAVGTGPADPAQMGLSGKKSTAAYNLNGRTILCQVSP
jgi:hypothetical protein